MQFRKCNGWTRSNARKGGIGKTRGIDCGVRAQQEHPRDFIARWRKKKAEAPGELGARTAFEGFDFNYLYAHDPLRPLHSGFTQGMRSIETALRDRGATVEYSQPPSMTFAPDPLASATRDIVSSIDAVMEPTRVRLIGESWGALAAAAAAAQREQRVDALVLISPPFASSEALEQLAGGNAQLEQWRSDGTLDMGNGSLLPWNFAEEAASFSAGEGITAKALVFIGHHDEFGSLNAALEWVRRAQHLTQGRQRRLLELRKAEDSQEISSSMARLLEFLDLPQDARK